jgi:uncharacterized protein YaiI (UPF0178 family)
MRIWIDADACPRPVREIVLRASERRHVPLTFVANKFVPTPNLAWINSVQVSQGMDVADTYIVQHLDPSDLVVTQDVPLAAEVVEKGALAISHRGVTWTAENVREKLSMRDFFTEVRESGIITGGPPPYDNRAKQAFANALDRWLTKAIKEKKASS